MFVLFMYFNLRVRPKYTISLLIDAHRGVGKGWRGVTSCTPYKDFEKLPHKNAIKHDPPDFLTTPSTPQKNLPKKPRTPPGFPTTVHLWVYSYLLKVYRQRWFVLIASRHSAKIFSWPCASWSWASFSASTFWSPSRSSSPATWDQFFWLRTLFMR